MTDHVPSFISPDSAPVLPPIVPAEPEQVIPPVQVAVIGTKADVGTPLTSGTAAVTPDHQPNIIVTVITPIAAVAIRFANTFLTGLLGILTGALATNVITASDFIHLVIKCGGLALCGAGLGLIKDLITIFGKLEGKFPLLTGSI